MPAKPKIIAPICQRSTEHPGAWPRRHGTDGRQRLLDADEVPESNDPLRGVDRGDPLTLRCTVCGPINCCGSSMQIAIAIAIEIAIAARAGHCANDAWQALVASATGGGGLARFTRHPSAIRMRRNRDLIFLMDAFNESKKLKMENSYEFLALVLDSVTEHIVVINRTGGIEFVNKSWSDFGRNNACLIRDGWNGVNYLEECDKAAAMGDKFGVAAGFGIRNVIEGESIFHFEYPCHSPNERRWFMMRVTPFHLDGTDYFVISHQNITERKLAEEEARNIAKIDGLTGIPNRRAFDEFLNQEWRRCLRLKKPICLAMIDIDYFKFLNDTYGHQIGDEILTRIGSILKKYAMRPGDICARYGGEEFSVIWGDTSLDEAKGLSKKLLDEITELGMPNINSPVEKYVTVSVGISEVVPAVKQEEREIIARSDRALYKAKEGGRNRVWSE